MPARARPGLSHGLRAAVPRPETLPLPMLQVSSPSHASAELIPVSRAVSSKMALCLVEIGCSMKQKIDIFSFCTRKGYCKDGYCAYRDGDLTPRLDIRPEVFAHTSVKTPDTPCIDDCCPAQLAAGNCTQNATLATVRTPGRTYRKEEAKLPPRQYVAVVALSAGYRQLMAFD